MAITPVPTTPEAKGKEQVNSTKLETEYSAISTSGINNFVDAPLEAVSLNENPYKIPGIVVQGGMMNKYIVLANKKIYTINASSAKSALKKVCSTIRLKSGKVSVQKVNPKRKTMIHEYKVRTLKNGKFDIVKL